MPVGDALKQWPPSGWRYRAPCCLSPWAAPNLGGIQHRDRRQLPDHPQPARPTLELLDEVPLKALQRRRKWWNRGKQRAPAVGITTPRNWRGSRPRRLARMGLEPRFYCAVRSPDSPATAGGRAVHCGMGLKLGDTGDRSRPGQRTSRQLPRTRRGHSDLCCGVLVCRRPVCWSVAMSVNRRNQIVAITRAGEQVRIWAANPRTGHPLLGLARVAGCRGIGVM